MYPKITIVTPSYNHGQFLEQTIKSALDQNYPGLEYIIMEVRLSCHLFQHQRPARAGRRGGVISGSQLLPIKVFMMMNYAIG